MEEVKSLQLKLVHLILLGIGVVISILSIILTIGTDSGSSNLVFNIITNALRIAALIAAFIYLVSGYKKDAAKYYKAYMVLLLLSELFFSAVGRYFGSDLISAIANLAGLIFVSILATGKDIGKKNTIFLSAGLLVARAVEGIIYIIYSSNFGAGGINAVLFFVAYMILACTTIVMVLGKYNDKDARGTT